MAKSQKIDLTPLKACEEAFHRDTLPQKNLRPLTVFKKELNKERGEEMIAQGKCALLILAGGSGSRLNFEGPKGCFPISPIKKKSLFEIHMEKVKAASSYYNTALEVAIMTSPFNHAETIAFFEEHHFFGIDKENIHFFSQELAPLLNEEGEMFLEKENEIALGPNGNGRAFHALMQTEIYSKWEKKGIEIVNVIPVDNPLATPFDPFLFHEHSQERNEITIITTPRKDPNEKVGIVVEGGRVLEYSECVVLGDAAAYIGLFCISFSSLKKIGDCVLPLHKVKKKGKSINGVVLAWKFEYFLFDLFPYFKVGCITYLREECFAPLKNFEGEDSIITVQEALIEKDRKTFNRIAQVKLSERDVIELSQNFYYPTKDLMERWEKRVPPNRTYIT